MGVTGAGKSTFISLLSDEEIKIGHGLESCKHSVNRLHTAVWISILTNVKGTTAVGVYHFMLNGVRVWLIDTPGFDDTNRSDVEVLKDVAFWLAAAYTRHTRLAGILYLHRITETRFLGSAKRNLRMFQQLCGTGNLASVILATTHWTDKEGKRYPEDEGQRKIKQLVETEQFWGGMVARGSRVERHDGTKQSAKSIISKLVARQIRVVLDIQRQLIDENKSLDDTYAGQALQSDLIEERQRSRALLADLKLDMEFALKEKDVKWQQQIEKDRLKFEADIRKGYEQTKELETNMKAMAEEKEVQIREMEAKMEKDRKLYEEQMTNATKQINAIRTEQRTNEAKYHQERREAEQKAERLAAEHREALAAEERRIRAQTDKERRAELAREKEELEARFTREREEARLDAEERGREWEEQQMEYRRRQADFEQQREADRIKMEGLALEARKSRDFLHSAVTAVLSGVIKLGLQMAVAGLGPGFGSF